VPRSRSPSDFGEAVYPDSGPADGAGASFALLFFLVLMVGIGITVWKVTTARRMAREAGMNEGDATAMALLTDDGFEATYLASNLRQPAAPTPSQPAPPTRGSTADRLNELQNLLDQGLVTQEEFEAARKAILDSL
jgi:hypothetical protein